MKRLWILLLALLVLCAAGCVSEDGSEERENQKTESADKALAQSMEALVTGEGDTIVLAADGTAVAMGQPTGIAAVLTRKLSCDIRSVEVTGSTATAQLRITAPDAAALVRSALDGMTEFDETAFLAKLEALAGDAPAETVFDIQVELQLVDRQWCIIVNDDFRNAITGGLASEYTAVRQSIMDALTEGGDAE